MKKNPFVSVVIPVKNLTYYLLHENLPRLANQTYKNYEVIVLPNEHSQYDLSLLREYKKLRIVPTGKITRPAEKRDVGADCAKGEIIAFLDDDAYPDSLWLKNAVKLFKKRKIQAVCGPGVLPENTNIWEKIFDEVLKTWIGAGGYSYRFTRQSQRSVTDYPSMNFLILKKTFLKLGGFNSDYWPGEDSKLCNDLVEREDGVILYDPGIVVFHHRRNNLPGFLKQHANYGFHRGAFFAHGDKNSRKLGYVIPTGFLLYMFFLSFYLLISFYIQRSEITSNLIALAPLLVYGILIIYLFIKSFINTQNILISIGSMLVLFLTHIAYGSMFIKGFVKGLNKNSNLYD